MSEKLRPGQKGVKFDNLDVGKRDAFHVPGVLVTSSEKLDPGTGIKFLNSKTVTKAKSEKQGIVDPFLQGKVEPYEKFWVFVCPEIVGNLVHEFEIAGVEKEDQMEAIREQIRQELIDEGYEREPYDDGCRGCY